MTIYDRTTKKDQQFLSAIVKASGDLVFEGQDLGDLPKAAFGEDEYEYWLTVKARQVPLVLLNLIKERFTDMDQFREWAEAHGIPSEFHSYF